MIRVDAEQQLQSMHKLFWRFGRQVTLRTVPELLIVGPVRAAKSLAYFWYS